MIRKINEVDSRANIVPIDYDPSATRVNQENRIKLMLSIAKENWMNKQGNRILRKALHMQSFSYYSSMLIKIAVVSTS